MTTSTRRSFIRSASLLAAATAFGQSPASKKVRLVRLETFYLSQGDQGPKLTAFYRAQMPLLTRHVALVGVFNSVVAPRGPAILVAKGYTGYDQMQAADKAIRGDAGYQKAFAELENPGPVYDAADNVLVETVDFSPDYTPPSEKPKVGRIFELRFYHTPTERQHGYLIERMAGVEGRVFHRVGIDPIIMGTMVAGVDMPNWVYLTPFNNLAEREKAWDAFAVDAEWLKGRAESITRGGQIVTRLNIGLYRAADFSQIQ